MYSVDAGVLEGVVVVDDASLNLLEVKVKAVGDKGKICRYVSNTGGMRVRGKLNRMEMRTLSSATVSIARIILTRRSRDRGVYIYFRGQCRSSCKAHRGCQCSILSQYSMVSSVANVSGNNV